MPDWKNDSLAAQLAINALFGRAKGNYIANWVRQQPNGVFRLPAPPPHQGFQYVFNEGGWRASNVTLTRIGGPGAQQAVAAVEAVSQTAEEGAAVAARSQWGTRLRSTVKIGGRVLAVLAVGSSLYEIATAHNIPRQIVIEAGGFAGMAAGAAGGAELGLLGGPIAWLTAPAGAILGGIGGFWAGRQITRTVFDWVFSPGLADARGSPSRPSAWGIPDVNNSSRPTAPTPSMLQGIVVPPEYENSDDFFPNPVDQELRRRERSPYSP